MNKKDDYFVMYGTKFPRWKDCPECGRKLSCRFLTYAYQQRCSVCQKKKDKTEGVTKKIEGGGIFVKRYKEVAGFLKTASGETVGITDSGKIVKKSETRYDLKNDPFGWRAAGVRK